MNKTLTKKEKRNADKTKRRSERRSKALEILGNECINSKHNYNHCGKDDTRLLQIDHIKKMGKHDRLHHRDVVRCVLYFNDKNFKADKEEGVFYFNEKKFKINKKHLTKFSQEGGMDNIQLLCGNCHIIKTREEEFFSETYLNKLNKEKTNEHETI
tara:strand:- start:235 stop:702 length:468 start_codon:yes stop_codon:yes gene_type:complete